ncbi:MAG: alpha/beta fold hydrolase [Coriobacteriia bacterium]|nr:alpha/beta fold hydrolase [Coriobacteriia bacterium]
MDYAYDLQHEAAQNLADYKQVEPQSIWVPSANGKDQLHVMVWRPLDQPRAVVQLVHGMAEHIARYADFASCLACNGYAVVGHDQLGHGRSCAEGQQKGHLTLANGVNLLLEDVKRVGDFAQREFNHAPLVLLGHSMGSFTARCYAAEHGDDLAAVILSGTGNPPLAASKGGNLLCKLLGALRGETHRSKLVDSLATGGYNKSIATPRTPFDWLSYYAANVDAYVEDPDCGFMFSVGGYAALTELTARAAQPATARRYPTDLPMLLISGEDDPVGGTKADQVKAAHKLISGAKQGRCDLRIFPYMRHEILNERENRAVYAFVLEWLNDVLAD